MNEVSVTLPLVASKNSTLAEVTYRKNNVTAVASVIDKPDQCVVYAYNVPPMAVALPAEKVKMMVFGEVATCAK